MDLLDILTISPYYFYKKCVRTTIENLILILGFKGLVMKDGSTSAIINWWALKFRVRINTYR